VLGALFATKGLARLRATGELEAAWAEAVGQPAADQTAVGGIRHGVLTVVVGHPTLLEELSAFRKPMLLAALREKAPGVTLHDIRFRIGPVGQQDAPDPSARRPRRGG
jgi:predicted nucleic acid-binding Zn ribbon protein